MSSDDRLFSSAAVATEELVVSSSAEAEALRTLLECLAREDCVHSWRNFDRDGTCEDLLRWENARRPTELFFYHLKFGDRTQLVGAGAVADRLTRDFPNPGFCVLGRCCILPEFRGRGFYRHFLHHRLNHCQARFGGALKAVHIGAVDERVSRVITNHRLPGWPEFVHLGEEALHVAGQIRPVGAYLLLMPDYVRSLVTLLAGEPAPPSVAALRRELLRIGSSGVRNLGVLVKDCVDEATTSGWFDGRDRGDIEELLLFCRSIPLVGLGAAAPPIVPGAPS